MLARLRRAIFRVANTCDEELHLLPTFETSLLPLLSASSFLYGYIISVRWKLYQWRVLRRARLPLPVISVGNISWGGNGKTPMVEHLCFKFLQFGIRPLLLTRGYGNGDEVRLLESHLQGTRAIIGAGIDRLEVANAALRKNGVRAKLIWGDGIGKQDNIDIIRHEDGIGVIIMDDGMQHWRVARDCEIVMVNAISQFGNGNLIPRGPLRENLDALCRAEIAVIHHANLVAPSEVDCLKKKLQSFLPGFAAIFCTQMVPHSLLYVQRRNGMGDEKQESVPILAPLSLLQNFYVLCISGIGCPESMTLTLQQQGSLFVGHMDFPDHHNFAVKDLVAIKQRLSKLAAKFGHDFVIVTTEKDYARCPRFFWQFEECDVYILQSSLEIMEGLSAAADLGTLIASKLKSRKGTVSKLLPPRE